MPCDETLLYNNVKKQKKKVQRQESLICAWHVLLCTSYLAASGWSLHDGRFGTFICKTNGRKHVTADVGDEDKDSGEGKRNAEYDVEHEGYDLRKVGCKCVGD